MSENKINFASNRCSMNHLCENAASGSEERPLNFLEEIIEESIAKGEKHIQTRFPPEPNGYLHIGHAKSICLNFGLAKKYGGKCNLRFDDTNPVKEDVEYVDSIQEDVHWLGFDWAGIHYASDYFDQLYEWALVLIRKGLAYVDDQSQEEIRLNRGTVTVPGKESPYRNRSVEENLDLFQRMKNGEFADGEKVLRAKIDMAHPNMLLRDPILYRIVHAEHHRTGNKWCIYPMYDYAHGQSDSIEHVTHSICTLEFDVHRPLYDWFIEKLEIYPSHQYEFARLNLTYTLMSKRKLLQLVQQKSVMGWDDPRMPTICALRRRGYTPESVRMFADKVGVAKRDNVIDYGLLEFCVREDLNKRAQRRMAVLDPIRVVITNYPEGKKEMISCVNNPEDESAGRREVPFGREIFIERDDFMEEPLKKSISKRLPWLIILLGLGMVVSSVVGLFEGIVAQLTILVSFQSLVLDMAGNVGTQSLAVTIRVLMDEQITGKQKLALIVKETRVGALNGIVLAAASLLLIGAYICLIKGRTPGFAFAVSACIGIALLISMTLSSVAGTAIPILFKKLKIDPAVASGPLITTVNDLVAAVSYYGLAWLLLIQFLGL